MEVGAAEVREELAVELREEVAVEVREEVDTQAESIRVDSKLDTDGN